MSATTRGHVHSLNVLLEVTFIKFSFSIVDKHGTISRANIRANAGATIGANTGANDLFL